VAAETWVPDVLGDGFEQETLLLPALHEGDPLPEITLVRYTPSVKPDGSPRPAAVLYVHGFCDYFFHPHVAKAWSDAGYAFYALDMRGYGRSLQAHLDAGGDPNMVDSIARHGHDLDVACAAIREAGHSTIVLNGHSLGGLIATMWTESRPTSVDALILNSPWYDLAENAFLRGPVTHLISTVVAPNLPRLAVGGVKPYYHRHLHSSLGGEWDFNLNWKPMEGFPVRAEWFASIRRTQARLNKGLTLRIPTLVGLSNRTGSNKHDHDQVLSTDSVLSVEQIRAGAEKLGPLVDLCVIDGGAHDLALTPEPVRSEWLQKSIAWAVDHVPPTGPKVPDAEESSSDTPGAGQPSIVVSAASSTDHGMVSVHIGPGDASFVTVPTPDGPFVIIANDDAVLASGWTDDVNELAELIHDTLKPNQLDELASDEATADAATPAAGILRDAAQAVSKYYAGDFQAPAEVPVTQHSGPFRMQAWDTLRTVPAGTTWTYTEFALNAGRPAAVRAAAAACSSNAAALFVPCHRIVKSDGSHGGFRYGLGLKESLLGREAA
jgi:O-6-methylguanine DNA methyltransferase